VRYVLLLLSCLLFPTAPAWGGGARAHPESWYQRGWCADRGRLEVVLPDGTRCDCLTETHAVEFDFASKWAEAIGQSLRYASATGRRPGIVLILERPGDERYLERIRDVDQTFRLGLTVWTLTAPTKRTHSD
jgi:hypothetical protein